MRNKKSSMNLKQLIVVTIMMFVVGIIGGTLNLGQINERMAALKSETVVVQDKKILDTETIVASYEAKTEQATDEVVARYARSRVRERAQLINEIKISKNMDLTERCNISREEFIILMAGVKADASGFFEQNAGLIYDLCEKYQINEIFFCGLISAESGWNIAGNHRRTHNYISLMNGNGLIKFASVEEGLEKAAIALHKNYLTPGGKFYKGKTLEGVRTRFCPVNPNWTNLVYGRMEQIV